MGTVEMRRSFVLPNVARAALAAWCRGEDLGEWLKPWTIRGRLRDLLGRKSLTPRQSAELQELEQRASLHASAPAQPSRRRILDEWKSARDLKARMAIIDRYEREIRRRGGETTIEGSYRTEGLGVTGRSGGFVVLHAEGWRQYSRGFGARRASLSYLCGEDDNGPWAVRVPGTIKTVGQALQWVTPVQVREAENVGRRVLRQGDVYAVESRVDRAAESAQALDRATAHIWDEANRILRHQPYDGRSHADLTVPFPCRFVQQRAYRMGRSGRRGAGD